MKAARGAFSKFDLTLSEARDRLRSDKNFQGTLSVLKKEEAGDLDEDEAAKISVQEMRELPKFLEDTWTEIHDPVCRKDLDLTTVYNELGYSVLLCNSSRLLWRDEPTPKSKRYWSRFRKFAAAMKRQKTKAQGSENPAK